MVTIGGNALVWDLTDPARAHRLGQPLTGHAGAVSSVAFARNRTTLATGGYDGTTILWDFTDRLDPAASDNP